MSKGKNRAMAMQRMTEWILVVLGALLCIGGAIGVWKAQLSSPAASLWPFPALVLIEWMLLGALGMIAAFGDRRSDPSRWTTVRWFICGALFGLLLLGVFSIGPLVLVAALAFLVAVMLAERERQHRVRVPLGILTAGTLGNVGLLLTLLSLAHVS
jgi:uncharacterized membrane protein HdeD (DUF308 family)